MRDSKQICRNENNKKKDCFACEKYGRAYYCRILNDADFSGKKNICSFYKPKITVMEVDTQLKKKRWM